MIPKELAHIWIGPLPQPTEWMQTWQKQNPDWNYRVFGNQYLSNRQFRLQSLIDEYLARGEYSGVADLMRYEILYDHGGFIAPADAICYRHISELFTKSTAYTVYENEFLRGALVAPVLACEPQNPFVGQIIDRLAKLRPVTLLEPWKSTGNLLVAKLIHDLKPEIEIFPSHFFNPTHYEGWVYNGDGPVYAKQMFGSTTGAYKKPSGPVSKFLYRRKKKRLRAYRKEALKAAYELAGSFKLDKV